jgi:hypothetical protein
LNGNTLLVEAFDFILNEKLTELLVEAFERQFRRKKLLVEAFDVIE